MARYTPKPSWPASCGPSTPAPAKAGVFHALNAGARAKGTREGAISSQELFACTPKPGITKNENVIPAKAGIQSTPPQTRAVKLHF
jgi:hypothetical protein